MAVSASNARHRRGTHPQPTIIETMSAKKVKPQTTIPLLKVRQWLQNWDQIRFDKKARQSKPAPDFFLCSIKASDLKALTGVYRRSTKGGVARAKDPNVQRGHEEERSATIRDYVRFGFLDSRGKCDKMRDEIQADGRAGTV